MDDLTGFGERKFCIVFGCKRWSRKFRWEFMCRDHWRTVPKNLKQMHSLAKRKLKRNPTRKNRQREYRIWRRCVGAANHEQFGLGA